MVELIPDLPDNVIGFSARGKVTAEDYESIILPTVEEKLATHAKLRVLYHLGPEYDGFTPGAVWDDMKVGFKHPLSWEKIAVVTDVEWIRGATRFLGLAIPCAVRIFAHDALPEALAWISS